MVGRTILVLDKNASSRKFLASLLREKQFNIIEAASGKEALIAAWREEPDLIPFDPVPPELPNEDFIQKVRLHPRRAGTPLAAFSSDPGPARRAGHSLMEVKGIFGGISATLMAFAHPPVRLLRRA